MGRGNLAEGRKATVSARAGSEDELSQEHNLETTPTPSPNHGPEASLKRSPLIHLGHPDNHLPFYETPDAAAPPIKKGFVAVLLVIVGALAVLSWFLTHSIEGHAEEIPMVHGAWTLPFALLLASIAIMPFAAKHFWEHYYWAVSVGLGAIVIGYYIVGLGAGTNLYGHLEDYVSFIVLLGSLFTVSGGILIRVRRKATPLANTIMLLLGAVLANVFGTTGAAMLLIRPFIRMNKGHIKPYHPIFFIFCVANVGGALTPIGDPPLFLGYLRGVPFWWVVEHCWSMWSLAVGVILAIFYVIDSRDHKKQERVAHDGGDLGPAISLFGAGNLLFVGMILLGVFMDAPYREIIMAVAAGCSLLLTPRRIHVENRFNFAPIKEVAILFVGIFATMVPALDYLKSHAEDKEFKTLLNTPGQYYFLTGALSSVLDNAPTYLTFLESELGKLDKKVLERAEKVVQEVKSNQIPESYTADLSKEQKQELTNAINALAKYHPEALQQGKIKKENLEVAFLLENYQLNWYLIAISLGAVFFGACTYIGNGPNFMVKSIAEHEGVQCPSFFNYILCYTLPVLLPAFILVWAIFLRIHGAPLP